MDKNIYLRYKKDKRKENNQKHKDIDINGNQKIYTRYKKHILKN